MLDRIEFFLGEALISLRRNTWMTFAAITTAAMALVLLGGLGYAYTEVNRFAKELTGRFEMCVFLKDSLKGEQIIAVGKQIQAVPGVRAVRYVPKEDGRKRFEARNPKISIDALGVENPFPNAYDVTLKDVRTANAVAKAIAAFPEVEQDGVNYLSDVQAFLSRTLKMVPWVGLVLGGLMLLTSGVLIYNAIRLTIMARRNELRIMLLVGATRMAVATPLLIEGLIQGALGGALAGLMLWPAHAALQRVLENMRCFGMAGSFPVVQAMWLLALAGAAYGLVCSAIAVREARTLA